jgi:23S rRNA (guanosine2251-2'-O)-methyltransferase
MESMHETVVIAHNIRSTHNVGALFRTADGLGITRLILSGYTPYPMHPADTRLPHQAARTSKQIHKTALGAELTVPFVYQDDLALQALRSQGYTIVGLEQDASSVRLQDYKRPEKVALLLGEETEGLTATQKAECDVLLEIPMKGSKESFNVSVAAGIALYALTLQS